MIEDIKMSGSGTSKVSNTLSSIKTWTDIKTKLIRKLSQLDKMRGHKFMTKGILDKAEKIWKQDNEADPKILVKYFSPSMTFYITDIDVEHPEYSSGYVFNDQYKEWEFGWINLVDLSIAKNSYWMPVERDMHFTKVNMSEVVPSLKKTFSENLVQMLDDEINWNMQYDKECTFYFEELTNEFEVVRKMSDWLQNWDDVIISHKDLTSEEKELPETELTKLFIKKLNERL